jgi:WD40 repeat protein
VRCQGKTSTFVNLQEKHMFARSRRCSLVLVGWCLSFLLFSSTVPAHAPNKETPAPSVNHVDQLGDPLPFEARLRIGTSRFHHPGGAGGLTWTPDGKTILSLGRDDPDALLWDNKTGNLSQRFRGHAWPGPCYAEFVAGGKRVITLDRDSMRCWDVATGKEIWRDKEEMDKYWIRLFMTPDGKTIICPCPEIYCWDVETGKRTQKIPTLPGNVEYWSGSALTRDTSRLAVMDREHLHIWNFETEKQIAKVRVDDGEFLYGFTPDGNSLICYREDHLFLRDAVSGKKRETIQAPTKVPRYFVFSADGKQMAYNAAGDVVVCEFPSGKEIRQIKLPERSNGAPVAFSPDGKTLAAGGERSIYQWDVATGKELHPARAKQYQERSEAALSDDGKLLANAVVTRNADSDAVERRAIEIWDVPSGKRRHILRFPDSADSSFPTQLQFARDGKHLLARGFGEDAPTVAWEIDSGLLIEKHPPETLRPRLSSADVTCPDRKGRAHDLTVFRESGLGAVTFDTDDEEERPKQTLVLFNIADGREIRTLDWNRRYFGCLIFSPDGRTLAGGGGADTHDIFLWDVATGQLRAILQGHIGEVKQLAFSRDCTTLVSTSTDTTMLVWDLKQCGREGTTPPAKLTDRETATLWQDLASDNAQTAYRAVWGLAAAPNESLPLLRKQLTPVPLADAKQVQQWLSDLGHDDFTTRETASRELARREEGVQADLKKMLEEKPAPEAKRHAVELLDRLKTDRAVPSAERRQLLRAVEVLERMNADEARKLLAELAKGQRDAWLTRDAAAALSRLSTDH